jgi:small subunit ribosomal protein S1
MGTEETTPAQAEMPAAATETSGQNDILVLPAENQEINWDTIGKKQDNYSEEERVSLDTAYSKTLTTITEHQVIQGRVVDKTLKDVVVNINYKSEGVIPASEFRYNPELKVGDMVEVYVEKQEDKNGQLLLSHKKARFMQAWDRVNQALNSSEVIKGLVKCRTKGGLIVDVFGMEAFLPGSQIDVKPVKDYDAYVNKTMEFKVVKINTEYKNVVVSHKALIEAEIEQQKQDIIGKLEKGQILEGIVKNITSYGVFIDLGGVDGLIHITDLSWFRITHPEEVVKIGEKIHVVILDFDNEKKRIQLGYKQLSPHPWNSLSPDLKVGDKVHGKIVVVADYGAFIEIAPGIEGLIHVSEMSWSQHLRTAHDFLKAGNETDAIVLTLNREERKMTLGIKQLTPDPWAKIMDKYPRSSKHTGTVRNFTNFGIFVELEEGVDGLVHISDLSWSKKIKHPSEFTRIGDKLEVIVLEVNAENRRLSLGHKQLEENPWDTFETIFTIGSIHRGTITQMSDKGATVMLPYGVEGFAPAKHLVKETGNHAIIDETLDFKIIEFNKDSRKIILSHSRIHEDLMSQQKADKTESKKNEAKVTRQAVKQLRDNIEKTTLGDIGGLAKIKTDMDKENEKVVEALKEADKKEEKELKEETEKEKGKGAENENAKGNEEESKG